MNIERAAVVGAGVMGAGIAAHIANAGIPVALLDIVPDNAANRNQIAEQAIAKMLAAQPSPLMHPNNVRLISPGNIEDDLGRLAEADWIVEAVLEDPDIKRNLYRQLEAVCRSDALISSNTSTLPLKVLTLQQSESFKRRFMITHFFNPPRYMRLLELIAPPDIAPDLFDAVATFADLRLGKGCVTCKDTPGFIANRIGTFWIQTALLEAIANNLTVEECDAAMALFGIPKTGVFGLLDLVGLDLMPHVLSGFKQSLPAKDRLRAIGAVPPLLSAMIEKGYTGRKGLGGFYRLKPDADTKIKEAIDLQTGDYRISEKYRIDGVSHRPEDLKKFLSGGEALNRYAWRVWSDTLSYAASLIPEIADDPLAIDTAMRLGYNWRYGPFELLDRLGVDWFVERLQEKHQPIPYLLADRQGLYRTDKQGVLECKDEELRYRPIHRPEGMLSLGDIKRRAAPLLENASASLWDIGDGIVCLEFHSKMNTLDPDSLNLIQQSIGVVRDNFEGMVIHNEAEHFSAGANLTLLAPALMRQDWDAVAQIVELGQQTYQALKYAPFPVVGAPSGLALGGGCEILLHCDAVQAHAELYTGLVETGVGLVPGWGGCKELLRRWLSLPNRPGGPMPAISQAFETIALAKTSKSALLAKELLYLSEHDGITMNKDRLLADAKARVLTMIADYRPPEPYFYYLPGASARAALDIAVRNLTLSGKATAYDREIAGQLAFVLSGGDTDSLDPISEQDMLNLERQAFLHLVKQPGTAARLEHMLKTGKPLRN
ncbi:MAG: 3-hydroxyacyl-CoA dehydrogenase [Gammaproteobacteria bacterium HGW-Gammaproteobacteria-10]|nr:MAG: 3-hydroxyacyl-CoA dehydrogenase [Gammaproteobacteria bacterium HGW-Gammaproteobacteria-10]